MKHKYWYEDTEKPRGSYTLVPGLFCLNRNPDNKFTKRGKDIYFHEGHDWFLDTNIPVILTQEEVIEAVEIAFGIKLDVRK